MANNSIVWFEIYTDDIERAKGFYEKVFEVKLEKMADPAEAGGLEMWAFPMSPDGQGAGGTICKMEGFPAGRNSTIVYFHCEDCALEEGRVEGAGGKIERPKMSI